MPQPTKNAPDYIDVQNILGSLGNEYSLVVRYRTTLRSDKVEVIGEAYGKPYDFKGTPVFVALASFPIKQPKDMAQTLFTIAWDLWCQADGGGATAAKRGAPYSWSGYPEIPRRRKA